MPMRIIGGSAGGLTLKGPPRSGVRPTSDRVRESIFEILTSHGTSLDRVLDLYSGTGALGIEALSRGAEHCDFVESDARACAVIRENLARARLLDRATVYPLSVSRALARLSGTYGLVVADPPYEYDRAESDIAAVIERGLLASGGTLVVEHSKRKEWPETLAGRPQLLSRRYGDTRVTFYR
jgi:16S rRNA (guanine(966)-N(2))-methyltransferase RsmD